MRKHVIGLLMVFPLFGCIRTQEMPLAPNVVRLNTHASGLLYAGSAAPQTMKRAAELTLKSGYTHFRLNQVNTAQGSELVGVNSDMTETASGYTVGNSAFVTGSSNTFAAPIHSPTEDIGVTVIMFRADEPGAKGAFDAATVLRQQAN